MRLSVESCQSVELSSSAAVTTAYLMALCDVNDIEVSKIGEHRLIEKSDQMRLRRGLDHYFSDPGCLSLLAF